MGILTVRILRAHVSRVWNPAAGLSSPQELNLSH